MNLLPFFSFLCLFVFFNLLEQYTYTCRSAPLSLCISHTLPTICRRFCTLQLFLILSEKNECLIIHLWFHFQCCGLTLTMNLSQTYLLITVDQGLWSQWLPGSLSALVNCLLMYVKQLLCSSPSGLPHYHLSGTVLGSVCVCLCVNN